jgi:hypothetical protein
MLARGQYMNAKKQIPKNSESPRITVQTILIFFLVAILLSACAQPAAQAAPPAQPSPVPTAISQIPAFGSNAVASAAKSMLAKQLGTNEDAVQILDIQPVQWPDGCLGVHQVGIMCAFHVVDGYRITLLANDRTYEVHSNLDGSQIVPVP